MIGSIECDVHGEREATSICTHILDTLGDGIARGFGWCFFDDHYQAACDGCHAMSDEEWDEARAELIRVVCIQCFARAAAINGVELGTLH